MRAMLKRSLFELIPAVNGTPMPIIVTDKLRRVKLARPLQDRSKYSQSNTKGKR